MAYEELIVLLPCHSLEDFPLHHDGRAADGLLAACTALWHPALIAGTRRLPTWCRADMPPAGMAGRLLIVPEAAESWLPEDFAARAKTEKAVVIGGLDSRREIFKEALRKRAELATPADAAIPLVKDATTVTVQEFDSETIADFFALGYCRLHVELLTRVMRYTSTVDDSRLLVEVLAAVDAAAAGDRDKVQEQLKHAFEQLCESRRYFYPVDPYLIDLTLVAETTIGASLRSEVASTVPKNLLICGEVLDLMAKREPASIEVTKAALLRGDLCIVGGEYQEREFPLLPEETWREDLLKGIATYERILGRRPIVYGRRRAGLSPLLPQLLCRTGFQAALHFTLDDGHFPTTHQAKSRWNSPDGSVVEALSQVPLDAAKPEPFLELPRRLGEAMDREQVATLVFAHWPGAASLWYDDLRRVARYTDALGKFVTLENYFRDTVIAANYAEFKSDDYRTPYLQQTAGAEGGLSRFSEAYSQANTARTKTTLALVQGPLVAATPNLQAALARDRTALLSVVALNDQSFPVRHEVDCPNLKNVVVDIPAMGFAWIAAGTGEAHAAEPAVPMLEGTTLRNEFCEVTIDPETGGIRSINDYRTRGNRLSQQISLRLPGQRGGVGSVWRHPDEDAVYSVMIADSIEVSKANAVYASVCSRGRLVDRDGRQLAKFEQTTGLLFGSRVIRLGIKLTIDEQPTSDAWNSFYAVRFAFPDTDLQLSRNLGLGTAPTELRRIEAPLFVDVNSSRWQTSILSGGLPFHRRVLDRTLDTIIAVRGQSSCTADLGIGIDVPNSAAAALQSNSSPSLIFTEQVPPTGLRSGWFYHLDAKNVIATDWEPLGEEGFRVRLRETMGAAGRICLRSWRPIKSARQTDFLGNTLCELTVEHDKIWIETMPQAWIQVEALFQ